MSGKPIVHIEIPAQDPKKAAVFYNELFGWQLQDVPDMDYMLFTSGADQVGGFPRIDGQMYKPNDVTIYIDSDDIDETLQRIEGLGGKTLLGKTEIPGMGWFAFFADPSGNRIALYTAMSRQG
jgi:uncharacterized protein